MMKKILTLLLVIVLVILSAVSMTFAFLALSDISHDYVSKKALVSENIFTEVEKIPLWMECKTEWNIVRLDFLLRVVFMIAVVVIVIKLVFKKKE
jgi:hypothetical protein